MLSKTYSKLIMFLLIGFFSRTCCFSQESDFETMRTSVVAIGIIKTDSIKISQQKWATQKRFTAIGSGLLTYVKLDTLIIPAVATAGHVVKYFIDHNIDSFFIRFSWSDSIKTTDYFGSAIPRYLGKQTALFYFHPDTTIDLACILIPENLTYDKVSTPYYNSRHRKKIFPYNSMTIPQVGDQVWIYGYPGHIEYTLEKEFNYCITTFKSGIVTWKSKGNTNSILDKIIFAESNASFGNSGGPVFAIKNTFELVGILVGGFSENLPLKNNNKEVIDPISKLNLYTEVRSGVSIIVKAEYLKQLLFNVEQKIK